jgi:integrase
VAGLPSSRLSQQSHQDGLLSQALKWAVKQGYLGHNPCDLVDSPSPRKKTMRTLKPAEVEALLESAQGNYYYPLIYTAVSTGLRQAELLGLRWRDIDLDLLSISVSQVLYKRRGVCEFKEPKTAHSRRRVAMTPKLASFLRAYGNTEWTEKYYIGSWISPCPWTTLFSPAWNSSR